MHEDYFSLPIYIYIHSIIITLFIHINKSFWNTIKSDLVLFVFPKHFTGAQLKIPQNHESQH